MNEAQRRREARQVPTMASGGIPIEPTQHDPIPTMRPLDHVTWVASEPPGLTRAGCVTGLLAIAASAVLVAIGVALVAWAMTR